MATKPMQVEPQGVPLPQQGLMRDGMGSQDISFMISMIGGEPECVVKFLKMPRDFSVVEEPPLVPLEMPRFVLPDQTQHKHCGKPRGHFNINQYPPCLRD